MDNHRSPSPHSSARHTPIQQAATLQLQQPIHPQPQPQQPTFDSFDYSSSQSLFPDQSFATANGLTPTDFSARQQQTLTSNAAFPSFDLGPLSESSFDVPLFATSATADQSYINAAALDPALDPALLGTQISPVVSPRPQHNSLSPPGQHIEDMATTLNPAMHAHHHTSPHGSPAIPQSPFQPPQVNHSRNLSLDPSSAFGAAGAEWSTGVGFSGHRRTLSDAHSDISSAQHSPYGAPVDDFSQPLEHSPHMSTHDPLIYQDVMHIGQVSLSEPTPSYISPAHSPAISPRLPPTQLLNTYADVNTFSLAQPTQLSPGMVSPYDASSNFMQKPPFPSPGQEAFPSLESNAAKTDIQGHADAMGTPEINIIIAPPSRTNTTIDRQHNAQSGESLKPPERASRNRATSDPSSSRGSTPVRDTLSPKAAGVGSRSPSPSGKSRRSSTSNVPNRDYILDLADPDRPTSTHSADNSPGGSKRGQKHPATFQCGLCPKRFTRAYNLRSHLRTHTDERPFVCSHCGKAFARQHDRKRHEGLHSGEKKFVCRGQLKDGNNWGCGRRFARADALGRHFRSEAGRLCIKPLMDEEALERGLQAMSGAQNPGSLNDPSAMGGVSLMGLPHQAGGIPNFMYSVSGPGDGSMDPAMQAQMMPMRLPQALLAQYPTLSGIWDQLPANGAGADDIDGEISGRNSFSSAGEYEEEDWGSGAASGAAYGWASDVGP